MSLGLGVIFKVRGYKMGRTIVPIDKMGQHIDATPVTKPLLKNHLFSVHYKNKTVAARVISVAASESILNHNMLDQYMHS